MNQDIKKYPVYIYQDGQLNFCDITSTDHYDHRYYQLHHYVKQQQVKRHPELEQFQKLFLLPIRIVINKIEHNMHAELHNAHKDFEKLYGIKRSELLYGSKLD